MDVSAPQLIGNAPGDADLPRPRLELPPFPLSLGQFESALKLFGLGGVTSSSRPLPGTLSPPHRSTDCFRSFGISESESDWDGAAGAVGSGSGRI
jgi:hypothetical protein